MSFAQYNSPLHFPQESGVVEALQNDLTLRASTSGDVLVSLPNALRPEVDLQQDLGRDFLRWRTLYVGNINSLPIESYINSLTSINGLSGTLQLTSPNNTILIGDNGQSIELSGLFTQASGAILQQHTVDLLTLSGLIGGGGGDAGQTSINGLSGLVAITSPNGSILIGDNGQAIELSGLFTAASGAVLQQKCLDIDTLSGLILADSGQTSINGLSGVVDIAAVNNGITVNVNGQTIELATLFTYTSGQIIDQINQDVSDLSGLIVADTQTSINGLSGAVQITSPDGSILVGDNGQDIELSGLFTATSGAILQQKCEDIDTLSGLIGTGDAGQTSIAGISGVISLDSPNDTISIVVNGQTIELDGIFTWASGQLLESLANASGVQSLNGISGIIDLVASNNGITVVNNGQVIELSTLFTYTSGQIIEQNTQDILNLSGLILSDGGQTSINGLSGVVEITSPDGSILIGDSPQTIELSGLFTATSGALLQQKCEDVDTLSGLILADSGQTSINGVSGVVDLTSPNGTVLINPNGQDVELTVLPDAGQTSLNGFSGIIDMTSSDGSVVIINSANRIDLRTLFTATSGAILQQKCADIVTLSGLIGDVVSDAGQTSVNGISGQISLTSPDSSIGINVNGQSIELTTETNSGLCSVHTFTSKSGTSLTFAHNLGTEDFVWSLWQVGNSDTGQTDVSTLARVYPSGPNHVVLDMEVGMNGKLVIQGCVASGLAGITIGDALQSVQVSGSYTADDADSIILVDASAGDATITLPNPSGVPGRALFVKKLDSSASTVTVSTNGSGLIDDASTAEINSQYSAIRVNAHGGNWWIL